VTCLTVFIVIFSQVIEAMMTMKNPDLLLEEKQAKFMDGRFFEQKNIKASRKQILPIVKQILNRY
jgi:inorganic pyrophosphatase/exopolyphosphatase